jgi:hypothetical protein
MLWKGAWTALIAITRQAPVFSHLAIAMAAMGAALMAPALGLLMLAALAALALAARQPFRTPRLDSLGIVALVAMAAAAAAAGLAGATGVLFVWTVIAAARRAALGERLVTGLAAAFVICLVAAAAPHVVMGLPLTLPHPPQAAIMILGLAYSLALVDWIVRVLARWRLGEARLVSAVEGAALHAVLLAGFALCPDVSAGMAGLLAFQMARASRFAPASVPTFQPQAGS